MKGNDAQLKNSHMVFLWSRAVHPHVLRLRKTSQTHGSFWTKACWVSLLRYGRHAAWFSWQREAERWINLLVVMYWSLFKDLIFWPDWVNACLTTINTCACCIWYHTILVIPQTSQKIWGVSGLYDEVIWAFVCNLYFSHVSFFLCVLGIPCKKMFFWNILCFRYTKGELDIAYITSRIIGKNIWLYSSWCMCELCVYRHCHQKIIHEGNICLILNI